MSSTNKNIDQLSNEAKSSTENQLMPKWQDVAKVIKEIVIVADYCGKPRDGKFIQGYKKQYRNLFEYAKNRFPNKKKYMEMKEQYKQWYRFEPRLLKAIEDLNCLYYKLAKPHFKDLTKIRSEIDQVCKLQQDLVLKEDYIKYLEKEILIRDEDLDPLRLEISNLKEQLEKMLQNSINQENYIDYLEKRLAIFQDEIDKLNEKIFVLYKNSNDTIEMVQPPGSSRTLSLPENQATIQKCRITREANSIREYFESPITIAPSLDDINENLDIISDAGERFERLVLQIYPRANARAINAENRVANLQNQLITLQTQLTNSQTQFADSQTQLAMLQNDYDLLHQAYEAHRTQHNIFKSRELDASREKQSLASEKRIFEAKPKQVSQVDLNTEAVRQFIDIMKQAKKTLSKKPGPGKEKADKIHIDRFLNDLVKDDPDPDPNSFYDDDDPIEDIHESSSESSSENDNTTSSENELETNTLSYSQSKLESSESSESESSNSESDSDEYEVNATKKKISFSNTKSSKKRKSARSKTSSKKSSNTSSDKKSSKDIRLLKIPTDNISLNAFFAILRSMVNSFTRTQPKEVSINGYNMINAEFIALNDPVLNHFTSNFSDKEREKFWNEITMVFSHILQPISDLIRIAAQQANTLSQKTPEEMQPEAEISWPNPIEINFIRKIIPNDIATITCQITSPSGKNIQVPGALIDSGANCSLKSKGLAKLLGMNIDKNKKPSVK
ncbi:10734_t:CDS:2 [Ambispora leptoticha]|uniref:10734_t:CDS:1 n=1 Tax=Ambispora leptoticha TaxID=144679 RepID=A0A9N9CMY0_9GLOM|nr:10734_t:CDS:2 [Ambispora leptoticha]